MNIPTQFGFNPFTNKKHFWQISRTQPIWVRSAEMDLGAGEATQIELVTQAE